MKKKATQTVENTTEDERKPTEDELERLKMNRSHGRGTEADGGGKKVQKVEKKCSKWTAGGLEHQDDAGRP